MKAFKGCMIWAVQIRPFSLYETYYWNLNIKSHMQQFAFPAYWEKGTQTGIMKPKVSISKGYTYSFHSTLGCMQRGAQIKSFALYETYYW